MKILVAPNSNGDGVLNRMVVELEAADLLDGFDTKQTIFDDLTTNEAIVDVSFNAYMKTAGTAYATQTTLQALVADVSVAEANVLGETGTDLIKSTPQTASGENVWGAPLKLGVKTADATAGGSRSAIVDITFRMIRKQIAAS